ncbi:MAG TPA: cytochrome c [Gemmataceae bacterium]|nr:cytochrome c [Gemmataceae bacterium]
MSSAISFARMVRVLSLAILCLLPLLSGCDLDSYPAEITYPLRSDPIVASPPGSTRWDTTLPGQLDNHIARLSNPEIGGKTLDPAKLPDADRGHLAAALVEIFGTPAAPTVYLKEADEETNKYITDLKLNDKKLLAEGSKVYRRHCMHCHGVSGDGRGPTGPWVNPTPRDYRQGLFKFMSTDVRTNNRKPRRDDLLRTLEHGIEGTSMPSFGLLTEDEKEELVSYVIHLSLRGECERYTMEPILDGSGLEEGSVRAHVVALLGDFLKAWAASNAKGMKLSSYPYKEDDDGQRSASIRRGFRLFTDPKGAASCINCHVDFGRQAPFRYDKWGTLVRPANLTAGVYRGGRRPLDIYWRIAGGIDPSQMPRADFEDRTSNKEQWRDNADPYWDLVNFVQALPYPRMLPDDIRDDIYGSRREKTEHAQR